MKENEVVDRWKYFSYYSTTHSTESISKLNKQLSAEFKEVIEIEENLYAAHFPYTLEEYPIWQQDNLFTVDELSSPTTRRDAEFENMVSTLCKDDMWISNSAS